MGINVALIGQAPFAAEVFKGIQAAGHTITGVFTIPDTKGKEDILATTAAAAQVPVFKYASWRNKGVVLPEVLAEFVSVKADLVVFAFVTQFIPLEICNHPRLGSICYHPSILPRHRGASAINWTIMQGDPVAGFTVFYPDDGLDTGDILLIRETPLLPDDTVNSIYKRFLFPEGVKGMVDAVNMLANGTAPRTVQPTEGATYDPLWKDASKARVDFTKSALEVHNFIRGNDRVPGAWAVINGQNVTLYGSTQATSVNPEERKSTLTVEGLEQAAEVYPQGISLICADGNRVLVTQVKLADGKTINAADVNL